MGKDKMWHIFYAFEDYFKTFLKGLFLVLGRNSKKNIIHNESSKANATNTDNFELKLVIDLICG